MAHILLATLGQRPEAITVALDLLCERYALTEVAVLHTAPQHSAIAPALEDLRLVLKRDYATLPTVWHELTHPDGYPIFDIESPTTASAYYTAILSVLLAYKQQGCTLHLLVAGGRKAMSIYAVLAASLLFDDQDRVWTVLSPEAMLKPGLFHIPPGLRDQVQIVHLPLLPARLAPGSLDEVQLDDLERLTSRRQNQQTDFLLRLSVEERRLADTLLLHPDFRNDQLAAVLSKSVRTVENQLAAIYNKMIGYFEFGETLAHKRQMLLRILTDSSGGSSSPERRS